MYTRAKREQSNTCMALLPLYRHYILFWTVDLNPSTGTCRTNYHRRRPSLSKRKYSRNYNCVQVVKSAFYYVVFALNSKAFVPDAKCCYAWDIVLKLGCTIVLLRMLNTQLWLRSSMQSVTSQSLSFPKLTVDMCACLPRLDPSSLHIPVYTKVMMLVLLPTCSSNVLNISSLV